ncbi:hypothetical protein KR054_002708 [Drosophila jambulina]|nr:hypothetical protein KR054_002708 [Drosophila jambulina]
MTSSNADIRSTDMTQKMQESAIDCAKQAIDKYETEFQIAKYVKNEFDAKFEPRWHCTVGNDFGAYVSHKPDHYIYFHLGQLAFLLLRLVRRNSNSIY